MDMPLEEYIKVAQYLNAQPGDKYVINFFQVGRLPLINRTGELQALLDKYEDPKTREGQLIREMFNKRQFDITTAQDLLVQDIGKTFLNSGATFHTMLLKPVLKELSEDFKYTPIATETEVVLKKLTHMTGGSMTQSNKMNKFASSMSQKEDIVYVLTYATDAESAKKNSRIKISVPKADYKVVYDDGKRMKVFLNAKKKIDSKKADLEIEKMAYIDHALNVRLKNIKMVNYDGKLFGAIRANIKVQDKRGKTLASFSKTYRGVEQSGVIKAELPNLQKGKYNLVLEVKDLFSMENKFVGDAIAINMN
jgi:hypothetical protein